ncbi:hypothetical protein TcasGA2_TC033505 [Tribolium castaneum]|uniref:Uncharacterized protein n=1 Tax=Tribolium castaneum TaxID=7070 RepID=A0A139W8F1_TRICA|nr:hypothetical protein TcasGA2_TC033505 [Tribolium castaneum]
MQQIIEQASMHAFNIVTKISHSGHRNRFSFNQKWQLTLLALTFAAKA